MKPLSRACVLIASLLFASTAAAQAAPTDAELAEARHSFEVATEAFEQGDYETAVSEFRAAYDLSRAADLLFNVYLAEERLGALPEAATALEQYLAEGTMEPEQHHLLEGRLERLRARIASHAPAVSAEEPQQLLASPIAVATPTEPTTTTPPPPSEPIVTTSPPMAAVALLVGAGALALNFVVFAVLSYVENQRLATTCGSAHGRYCAPSATDTLNTYNIVADASWITAAVVGAVDVVLWLVLPEERTETMPATASVRVRPWASYGAGGLVLGGQF